MSKIGFNWVTPIFCVSDLNLSLDYYAKTLGFEVNWVWSEQKAFDEKEKPTFACICRGEISIFLCENGQGNPGAWLCLNLSSAEALQKIYTEYRNNSALIVEEPQDCSWGMREMVVEDPDGNTLRIGCAIEST